MSNILKNLRDRFFRPPLLKWKLKPRLLSFSERTELIEIFVRASTWGIAIDFLAIFILYLFVPSISIPLEKIILYSVSAFSVNYFLMRYAGESVKENNYQIDNKGIKTSTSEHYPFLWKEAIGYSLSADEIFFVCKGGLTVYCCLQNLRDRCLIIAIA